MASSKYQQRKAAGAQSNNPRSMPRLPDDRVGFYSNKGGPKELPILLMLDVTPSMQLNDRIGQQNAAVHTFLTALCQHTKVRNAARVAFCLFTNGIVYQTGFMKLDELRFESNEYLESTRSEAVMYVEDEKLKSYQVNFPVFKAAPQGGTNIPLAVTDAVSIMQAYTRELAAKGVQKYAPFLVFTTDGNPDLTSCSREVQEYYENESKNAAARINWVSDPRQKIDDLIVPFFIGIGGAEKKNLRQYCVHFPEGVMMVDSSSAKLTFTNIFDQIGVAIAQSVVLKGTSDDLLNMLTDYIECIYRA